MWSTEKKRLYRKGRIYVLFPRWTQLIETLKKQHLQELQSPPPTTVFRCYLMEMAAGQRMKKLNFKHPLYGVVRFFDACVVDAAGHQIEKSRNIHFNSCKPAQIGQYK